MLQTMQSEMHPKDRLVYSDKELTAMYGEEYVRARREVAGLLVEAAEEVGVPVVRTV